MTLGATLQVLFESAENVLIIVAPFIKFTTLQHLLKNVKPEVAVCCVTRWRPEEIAVGVSDIEVWQLLKERGNCQLWLRNDLHAKYYRADGQCLIGSANLTATALGWSAQPNLEILLDVPLQHPSLVGFEDKLLKDATRVDDGLYEQTKSLVIVLTPEFDGHPFSELSTLQQTQIDREIWVPSLRSPEQLFVAYLGKHDTLSKSVYESAVVDMNTLLIPKELSKTSFKAYVGYVLLQMPIVRKVDSFVTQPRRFGEVSAYLKTLPCANTPEFDAKYTWQTMMRWLLCFLPTRYSSNTINYSEIFSRTDQ